MGVGYLVYAESERQRLRTLYFGLDKKRMHRIPPFFFAGWVEEPHDPKYASWADPRNASRVGIEETLVVAHNVKDVRRSIECAQAFARPLEETSGAVEGVFKCIRCGWSRWGYQAELQDGYAPPANMIDPPWKVPHVAAELGSRRWHLAPVQRGHFGCCSKTTR